MSEGKIVTFFIVFLLGMNINLFAQINNPPIARNDVDTADFNTPISVNAPGLLTNDSDPDGDNITITQFYINGQVYNAGTTVNLAEGTLTINADGSYDFTPTAGFSGSLPNIFYTITDDAATPLSNTAIFYLYVEMQGDLLHIKSLTSCNQGYTADGEYRIQYRMSVENLSQGKGYHPGSYITNLQLYDDLNAVFGDCITKIDKYGISADSSVDDFVGDTYPTTSWAITSWDDVEFNETDPTPGAQGLFNAGTVSTAILYPRQTVNLSFCVYVDPFCNGRPNPTPSGSGIDFDNVVTATSVNGNGSNGNQSISRLIQDFHTSDTTVAATLFVPESSPKVNYDGTYDYTNIVTITNDGSATANNVNYNMGLGNFIDNGINFTTLTVTQVGPGPVVAVNSTYNGDNDTYLLAPNQSLNAGETIYLEVYYDIAPVNPGTASSAFWQPNPSMTLGPLDGYDDLDPTNQRRISFVTWSGSQGNHVDRYYTSSTTVTGDLDTQQYPQDVGETASSNNQCFCQQLSMEFVYVLNLQLNKTIVSNNPAQDGVLEHREVTFRLQAENLLSSNVHLEQITLTDDLNSICGGNVLSVTTPTITDSNATTNPNINPVFNGTTDINIFDGNSGILDPEQFVEVEFTVVIADDCIGDNTATLSGSDPLGLNIGITGSVPVSIFLDSDNDGITDINDIDDDNDGIPDTIEYNGLDPLADDDNDNIPNYRDTDFGADINNDGIVDIFDFDMDGVPNHFDLDSDNDSIFDIVEAGNANIDTNNNGMTNNPVGNNGLDNTLEDVDTNLAVINYTIINTDTDTHFDYLDIDSDNDGIVDVIEAQASDTYINPDVTDANGNGIFDVYENLGNPVDTDGDNTLDYQDLNSDNDFYDDLLEGWDTDNDNIANIQPSNSDVDGDGLDDAFDHDNTSVNPTNGQVPSDFPNLDDPSTPELDWREMLAITVTIADQSVTEGGTMVFSATIDNYSPTDIVIEITTIDDTAIAPDDYAGITTPIIITIPAGTLVGDITIPITTVQDNIYEPDEVFVLNGNVTSNNTVNNPSAIGTIINNDPMPTITIADASADEGEVLIFNVSLSNPSSESIFIEFTTVDNTAVDGEDYSGINAFQVEIQPFTTNFTVDVNSIDDVIYEPTETFDLTGIITSNNTTNVSDSAVGTILDNEPYPVLQISNPVVVEGGVLVFDVTTEPATYQDITFNAFTTNGTAREPEDYNALSQSGFMIQAFTLGTQVMVQTNDDLLDEETEDMHLTAVVTSFNTDNLQVIGTGSILDNDTPNLFSPNGDGQSDVFEIDGMDAYPNFTLQIFDRYGSMVYDYQNKGNPNPIWWNGSNKGKKVPEGVYYYVLDYNDGTQKPHAGFIQLIR